MSRLGKRILEIPKGVTATVADGKVQIKGPKGTLTQEIKPPIKIVIAEGKIRSESSSDDSKALALQGLYNRLVENMIKGVTEGFEVVLLLSGVGYRAAKQGNDLNISIGFSHPVVVKPADGVKFDVEAQTKIKVSGADKQLVGEMAAKIRKIREVEPYKAKGIMYLGEQVRRKAGKAAKSAGGAA